MFPARISCLDLCSNHRYCACHSQFAHDSNESGGRQYSLIVEIESGTKVREVSLNLTCAIQMYRKQGESREAEDLYLFVIWVVRDKHISEQHDLCEPSTSSHSF
jgi:hypothetical protein